MKIASKERLVTGSGLAVIGIIALTIWWTHSEVESANRQRQATSEIARAMTELRHVTVEYHLSHSERTRAQWSAVSSRVDRLLTNAWFVGVAQGELLADLRERRAAGRRLFAEIVANGDAGRSEAASRQLELLLLSQLLASQQEGLTDIVRLTDLATDRIVYAQNRVMIVIIAGLALVAMIIVAASWFLRRGVLAPIAGLNHATRQVAAGDWGFTLRAYRNDEVGELSREFEGMTRKLQASFAQIERSNGDLAAANKELQAFSYSVSHDLRGPLRSMDGFALVLLEDYGDKLGFEGKDALDRIRAASQRMGHLIDDLLRLSQVTRAGLNVTRVDLSAIARDIADAIGREHPGRSVEWAIEDGLSARADSALIRIAIQNLLQNAWKFTGNAGQPVIRVGALASEAGKVYFVADNGVGFDMANAGGLFGAFQRMHHSADFPGSGIGLAIVQRIIGRHGGKIWAEAEEGKGATFFFRLDESESEPHEQDDPAG